MGSLFYINVPIREYEISLRQKAQGITVVKEVDNVLKEKITTGDENKPFSTTNDSKGGRKENHEDDESSFKRRLTLAGNLTTAKQGTVDLYEAVVEGRPANIVVSKDSMAIFKHDTYLDSQDLKSRQIKWKHEKMDQDEEDEAALQNIIDNTFLEKHLEDSLKKFHIISAKWGYSIDGNFAEVNFTVPKEKSEEILQYLLTLGVGLKWKSTLTVCAAVVFYNQATEDANRNLEATKFEEEIGQAEEKSTNASTFATKFMNSIKSRLTVAQVIQTVEGNAVMTFDFIILIIVAGLIAGFGLLENSSVSLVASMLISPLMGPIMAGCFGAVIRDWRLVKTGVISELVGLCICVLVGFICGICVTWAPFAGPWGNIERWPTDEMVSRGLNRGMIVGVLIAIPSGAGVALSILAGNAGSLVGVAISASLLPPAVNAGLFWGMAATISINEQIHGRPSFLPCHETVGPTPGYYTRRHKIEYCPNELEEFAKMGIVSFGLVILNIVIILTIGAIMLKIKEVAPHTTRKTMKRFWKEDLKVMRAYNRLHGSFDKHALLQELTSAENSEEIKENLANDQTYNLVHRRNLFGPSAAILDAESHVAPSEAGGGGDVNPAGAAGGKGQGNPLQPPSDPTVSPKRGSSGGTTFWGGLAGFFVGRRQGRQNSVQSDANEEELKEVAIQPKDDPGNVTTVKERPRPHLKGPKEL